MLPKYAPTLVPDLDEPLRVGRNVIPHPLALPPVPALDGGVRCACGVPLKFHAASIYATSLLAASLGLDELQARISGRAYDLGLQAQHDLRAGDQYRTVLLLAGACRATGP